MGRIVIAIGSNCNRERNMEKAIGELSAMFGSSVSFSPTIETEAIGMQGASFLNCVAIAHSDIGLGSMTERAKAIERACGDTREKRKGNLVEMDIDILEHDGKRYHEQDWERRYIKELMDKTGL